MNLNCLNGNDQQRAAQQPPAGQPMAQPPRGTNLLAAAGDPSRARHARTPSSTSSPEWVRPTELPHRVATWLLTRGVDLQAHTARRALRGQTGRPPRPRTDKPRITRTAIGRPRPIEGTRAVTL